MDQDMSKVTPKQEDPHKYSKKLVIRPEKRTLAHPFGEIDYLTSAANYVHVFTAGEVFRTRSTIKAIEQQFDPQKFGRVHRCTIVNFDRVKEFCALPRGEHILTLNDGTQLKMSRRHREQLSKIVALAHAAGAPPLKHPGSSKTSGQRKRKPTR